MLQEFKDVFLDEILGLPPKRDIDFTIDLVPGAALVSKPPVATATFSQNSKKIGTLL